ncbi:MAG: xanthine dehydrogenase family protein molybdopterin-binding subunit [Albidovulum sp.]|nr:xanthine dehydrogenase family protein molybdopterin-binding subunit [Albidovulum sp.]MDE0305214.1 xanthine dehydrogenase family protein molybdopterin-binding subunit [Albidovulum sp.]MDE0534157.1 xanthine dehydrogenase family protein molybdopterin-binding subunit [Albidovulum sp.]
MNKIDDISGTEYKYVGTRPVRPDGVDKVTGKAQFGADLYAPGMLFAKILRSPHAHARILSVNTDKAEALDGVKAVLTYADLELGDGGHDLEDDMNHVLENVMARGKALYDGHAVAAVAANSASIAKRALKLIDVEYEVLPHVTDIEKAIAPDAPIIHEDMYTQDMDPKPEKPSNVARRMEIGHGDIEAGFEKADFIFERRFRTEAAHQGYIEPHACLANYRSDGHAEIWCCTQGHFMVRSACAALLGMDLSKLRVTASEIGGGFGGKTTVFIEPVALALSRKCGRPVKLVMDRDEVFRASGPTPSSVIDVKIGANKEGVITAGFAELWFQGGAFPGSVIDLGAMCSFACYNLENVKAIGWDVVVNRPKSAAYRAPGAPMAAFAVESALDDLADRIGIDPIDFRLKNAAEEGTIASFGPKFRRIGLKETLEAAKASDHYNSQLGPNQGRGVASGFWFNFGGTTSASIKIELDGTAVVTVGTPDIGGSRASMCQMAAETLGIPYEDVRCIVADTSSLPYSATTEGSRTTHSSGMATVYAAQNAIGVMCSRAAMIWGIPEDAVDWKDGHARPSGANAGDFEPMSLAEIAKKAHETGGPIAGHCEFEAGKVGQSFGTHIADAEIDPETGFTKIVRYTVIQDAGRAIHPSYVEGQYQGGAVQGIGWALNEEYIYGEDGRLQNAGFLDYRMPVCSDVPMIETEIVEVPNTGHPFGVRGVGETPIAPPLGAIGNALSHAIGRRMDTIPMSPPRVLEAVNGG